MRRTTRLLIAAGIATFTVVWSLWSPFSPEGLNEALRSEPEVIPVSIIGWFVQFLVVFGLIRWVEEVL